MSKSSTVTVRERPVSEVASATAGGLTIHGETIIVSTDQRIELVDLTNRIMEFARKFNIREGLVSLWSMHTTCSLFINEFQTALLTDIKRFLEHVWETEKLTQAEGHAIMNLCMAATYDPDPRAPLGFRLPFNLESGELIPARWKNWLANDPINLVAKYKAALKSLHGIYIDCGWRDQYHIHYGARILSKRLAQAGIRHTYEEFDDNHSDIDYRMDTSLPFLARALSQAARIGRAAGYSR